MKSGPRFFEKTLRYGGNMETITAIVLAAGSGKRMNSPVQKQYMDLAGQPVICYALRAFEESVVTGIVLVTGRGETEYCRHEIVERYGFRKVTAITEGGKERYDSVYAGLLAASGSDYVLIHDGARPFVTPDMILRCVETVRVCGACVAGMPAKDTIRYVGEDGYAGETPDRKKLWQMQTPQTFSYSLIRDAYEKVTAHNTDGITDDAMVLERAEGPAVKIIEGSYHNIKITTPEDLLVAKTYLQMRDQT